MPERKENRESKLSSFSMFHEPLASAISSRDEKPERCSHAPFLGGLPGKERRCEDTSSNCSTSDRMHDWRTIVRCGKANTGSRSVRAAGAGRSGKRTIHEKKDMGSHRTQGGGQSRLARADEWGGCESVGGGR